MFRRVVGVARNKYVAVAVMGSLAGVLLLLLFLIIRGQRDTVVLHVQPIADASIIQVYVGGQVAQPGLYSLPRGSRVFDAINAAGGLLTNADTASLGLASPLNDADQVIVPPRAEPTSTPAPVAASGYDGATPAPPERVTTPTAVAGPLNVNTAGALDLERLPGIGPAIAQRIVEYRLENGPFQTIDEMAAVSGISERMVDELRPLVTLGY